MDSGSQLTAAEFKDLVRRFVLAHLRIRTYHPESNGVIEWFHWSTRDALAASDPQNLTQARALIGTWVTYYNEERLHAALGYLPPAEYYRGDTAARQRERQQKLNQARQARRQTNTEQPRQAA